MTGTVSPNGKRFRYGTWSRRKGGSPDSNSRQFRGVGDEWCLYLALFVLSIPEKA